MLSFIKRMIDINPAKRPTFESAQAFFKLCDDLMLDTTDKLRKVAIIDLNDEIEPEQKNSYLSALMEADEVIIIDSGAKATDKEYQEIKNYLRKNNIKVSQRIFLKANEDVSAEDMIIDSMRKIAEQQKQQINSYYFVSNDVKHIKTERLASHDISAIYS